MPFQYYNGHTNQLYSNNFIGKENDFIKYSTDNTNNGSYTTSSGVSSCQSSPLYSITGGKINKK